MDPVVATSSGSVRGTTGSGVRAFLGIPFAAAPVGPLRFALPAPPAPWDGVRPATALGPAPPQRPLAPGIPPAWRPTDGPDCLTVNVWTPDPGAAGLPVLVWIYGGGWRAGTAANPAFDGTVLATGGAVVVTFNYRVGFEGFGLLPDAPANRGLHDQLAALRWVRREIGAFGGDPGQVTVIGQSAGGASIALLLAAPAARGLFHRAIVQSPPTGVLDPADAERVTAAMAEEAGVAADVDGFAGLTPQAVLELREVEQQAGAGVSVFGPVLDGELVTGSLWAAVGAGGDRSVDLVCGFNHEEAGRPPDADEPVDLAAAASLWDLGPDAVEDYRKAYPGSTDADLFDVLLSDALHRMPATRIADAHAAGGGRTWLYDFTWRSPELGAARHNVDVPFTFGNPRTSLAAQVLGTPPPPGFAALSAEIRRAWVAFATTGDPGWPRYTGPGGDTRLLDLPARTVPYPLGDSRRIWALPGS